MFVKLFAVLQLKGAVRIEPFNQFWFSILGMGSYDACVQSLITKLDTVRVTEISVDQNMSVAQQTSEEVQKDNEYPIEHVEIFNLTGEGSM